MTTTKEKIESFMQWFGWSVGMGCFVTFFITFVMAYTTSDKSIIIHIDKFGEANLELFILCFGAVCILYMIYRGKQDEYKERTNATA